MEKLTILTRRVSYSDAVLKRMRNVLRFTHVFLKGGVVDLDYIKYGGHVSVTRSLIRGLREIGSNYNYNPVFISDIGDTVVVLSDIGAVRQAIELKKQGSIKKLLVGPNILEMPTKRDDILAAPEIDICLVPSDNTADIYERLDPALKGKVAAWYAGVDESFWKPKDDDMKNKNVLVYWKNAPKIFCLEVEKTLKLHGYDPLRVVYGKYSKKRLKQCLQKSTCAVFLSINETQGIALAEAWAMNIPTLVWDPRIEHYYVRGVYTTAAPYLSDNTGARWKEIGEFEDLIGRLPNIISTFNARRWVMEHMTDKKSAEKLIQLCK